jgi:hypothetical protein
MATDVVKDPPRQQEEGNEGQKGGQQRSDRGKCKKDNKHNK